MKMSFRWYGTDDPVTLEKIAQIPGMHSIVTAIYDVPVGQVWPEDKVAALAKAVEAAGLKFDVIESVPVHEDIKLGAGKRDEYIENYCTNIRTLAKYGVKVICYNFMPVFDWLRSDLDYKLEDGSSALIFKQAEVDALNPAESDLSLPGWDASYTMDGLRALLAQYKDVDAEKLWENFAYFLHKIIPVCDEVDMKMAIHPDDPPWPIFGLPRIITGEESYKRMIEIEPSINNGFTICTGSLGADPNNDLPALIRKYGDRAHFIHLRNIKLTGEHCFEEAAHLSEKGSLDMYEIVKAMHDIGFEMYVRPDHGRMIWGEKGRPGYGLFDRALGATYINGLWEAVCKGAK
ncbi:MAG: mannonate dehydratase [Clostridia bacterium]|nr:mannonate dehydratase [Clostridia bacterium]